MLSILPTKATPQPESLEKETREITNLVQEETRIVKWRHEETRIVNGVVQEETRIVNNGVFQTCQERYQWKNDIKRDIYTDERDM